MYACLCFLQIAHVQPYRKKKYGLKRYGANYRTSLQLTSQTYPNLVPQLHMVNCSRYA